MIIDAHTHIFPPRMRDHREDYVGRDPLFERLYAKPNAKIASCDDLMSKMDEEGIDRAVILNANWTNPEMCRETNDYIMESVARYPRRLVGFCSLPPKAGDATLVELERCIDGGIKGIGELRPDIQGIERGDEPVIDDVLELAKRRNLVLNIHASEPVGHEYIGKGVATPDKLYRFILRFPELIIVLAHWGGGLPFYALMPEVAEAMKNVYVDCSASPYLYRPEIFNHVAELIGAEKILFGSDYPLMPPSRIIKQLRPLGLDKEIEDMILSGNAARLF